jgi:hypothetical protein
MAEPKEETNYTGSCHCGKVRFDVSLALGEVYGCNCSICSRMGWRLAFAPASKFTLRSGEGDLGDYQFHKKVVHHFFCKTCGIRSFSRGANPDGSPVVSVNVRCLDGVDAETLPVKFFDGKSV